MSFYNSWCYDSLQMRETTFQRWFKDMTPRDKRLFVNRAGITMNCMDVNYLRPVKTRLSTHLKQFRSTRSQPSSKTMLKLVKASLGKVTYEDALDHFYRK